MSQGDRAFVGAIPEIYERQLGPMLFEPFAQDFARRFAGFDGELLETAAGTGRLTRALAQAAPLAAITATDLNAPMLAKAADQTTAPNVRFEPADAQALPFPDHRFDAVACQFGVMFFPDKVRALAEARRVLRPHGRLVFSVWDALELNPVSQLVHEAITAVFPEDPPSFFARIPFGWREPDVIRRVVSEAGFAEIGVETVSRPTSAPSALAAAEGLCLGTPLRGEIEAHGADALERAVAAAADALERRFGAGQITAPAQALVVTANP